MHFKRNSVIDGTSLAITPTAHIIWVGHQSLNDATAFLVDPQHALWALGGVVADTATADSTGVLAGLLEDIMTDTLLSMPGFHALTLEIHSYWVSAMSSKSSVQRISLCTPVWSAHESASSTWMKRSGLRTDPWWTATPNSSLYWTLARKRLRLFDKNDTHCPLPDLKAS